MLPGRFREMIRSVSDMRDAHFDWVIDLQGLARSGMFAWLANGAFTIGVEDPREGASLFYDEPIPRPTPATHAVDWYLQVLQKLDVPLRWDFEWLPGSRRCQRGDSAEMEHPIVPMVWLWFPAPAGGTNNGRSRIIRIW